MLGVVDDFGNVLLINLETDKIIWNLNNSNISTWGIAICTANGNLAISDNSHVVTAFNLQGITEDNPLKGLNLILEHDGNIPHIEFSNDGKRLVSASIDQTCKVWDLATGQTLYIYESREWCWSCFFIKLDDILSVDGRNPVWDFLSGQGAVSIEPYGPIHSMESTTGSGEVASSFGNSENESADSVRSLASTPREVPECEIEYFPNGPHYSARDLALIYYNNPFLTAAFENNHVGHEVLFEGIIPRRDFLIPELELDDNLVVYCTKISLSVALGNNNVGGIFSILNPRINREFGFDRVCFTIWIPEISLALVCSQNGIILFVRFIKHDRRIGMVIEKITAIDGIILGLASRKVSQGPKGVSYVVYCLTYGGKLHSFTILSIRN